MSYKSCGNCLLKVTCGETGKYWCNNLPHEKAFWQPIPCPLCGGTLSEIRTDRAKRWRHCYSCHMEQEETT